MKKLFLILFLLSAPLSAQEEDYNLTLPFAQKIFSQWKAGDLKGLDGAPDFADLLKLSYTRPVVFVVWASWCPYCRGSMPEVNKLVKSGLKVAGISFDRNRADFDAYAKKQKLLFTHLMKPQKDGSLGFTERTSAFAFPYIPSFLAVKDGKVVYYGVGGDVTAADVLQELAVLPSSPAKN